MSPERVTAADLLGALGVVTAAESDRHLAARLKRLAGDISAHLEKCDRCRRARESVPPARRFDLLPNRGAFCSQGLQLIVALGRAAAMGQRYADAEHEQDDDTPRTHARMRPLYRRR